MIVFVLVVSAVAVRDVHLKRNRESKVVHSIKQELAGWEDEGYHVSQYSFRWFGSGETTLSAAVFRLWPYILVSVAVFITFLLGGWTIAGGHFPPWAASEYITLPLRVNAGGNAYYDYTGNYWSSDREYVSGSWGYYGEDNTSEWGSELNVQGTDDDVIYHTERWGLSCYKFDLGDGIYDIVLHFSENWADLPGIRIFDVAVEGQLRLLKLDILSTAGKSTVCVKHIDNVVVEDGQLNIEFTEVRDLPNINGLEIFHAQS